jgi:hypothetical protein
MTSWPAANGIRWVKPSIARVSPFRTTAATPSASDTISAIGQQVPLYLTLADGSALPSAASSTVASCAAARTGALTSPYPS